MAGRVVVHNTQPRIPVADFRITEVQFNVAGGQDLIEISNLGEATGNLAYFRIATTTALPLVLPTLPNPGANDLLVPPGGRVVVHLNASSVNTATDLYIASFSPGTGLPDANGSLALYVPSSQAPANASSNANLMIDFVQWGAAGQPNETTANIAGFWTAGTSINGVAAGHSIEYCANATLDHGVARWAEIATPTFGGNGDCATPTASDTWGRLKVLYR
jgi:hypothetical protein